MYFLVVIEAVMHFWGFGLCGLYVMEFSKGHEPPPISGGLGLGEDQRFLLELYDSSVGEWNS